MLESLTKKQKFIFFIILLIMILFIVYYIYSTLYQNNFTISSDNEDTVLNSEELIENNLSSESELEESSEGTIIVYICGAVKESKVISLKEDSRIADAIEVVGGLTKDADLTNINLAYILEDGEKIYIPKKGEEIENTSSVTSTSSNASTSSKSTKININKATQTELETIPGVGPSTALKIINYRTENGKFSTIEDIKNVSGIGDAKFESMKDYICVK